MKPARRSFLFIPALGLLSKRRLFTSDPARRPVTRILCGGDVMLSRFVGARARHQSDPAAPLRDLAPLLSSAQMISSPGAPSEGEDYYAKLGVTPIINAAGTYTTLTAACMPPEVLAAVQNMHLTSGVFLQEAPPIRP